MGRPKGYQVSAETKAKIAQTRKATAEKKAKEKKEATK
jgi:hypothetical protein